MYTTKFLRKLIFSKTFPITNFANYIKYEMKEQKNIWESRNNQKKKKENSQQNALTEAHIDLITQKNKLLRKFIWNFFNCQSICQTNERIFLPKKKFSFTNSLYAHAFLAGNFIKTFRKFEKKKN